MWIRWVQPCAAATHVSGFMRSPSTSSMVCLAPGHIENRCFVLAVRESDRTVPLTCSPASSKTRATWPAMKPLTPVTRTFPTPPTCSLGSVMAAERSGDLGREQKVEGVHVLASVAKCDAKSSVAK